MTAHAYQDLLRRIDDRILQTFHAAEITEEGIDLDKEGLKGPGATWTYLTTDNPFGGWLERACRGIRDVLKKETEDR
jgi:preprotein translocase subunit SecA